MVGPRVTVSYVVPLLFSGQNGCDRTPLLTPSQFKHPTGVG